MVSNALVVNLFGGPGTGKSTTAASLFSELKWRGINCELVTEYAKELVWGEDLKKLDNQIYIFGKQHHRIFRLQEKVAVIVTDSPLLLSLIYGYNYGPFRDLVLQEHRKHTNLNVFLNRKKAYIPVGRMQTEEEACQIDSQILNILTSNQEPFTTFDAAPGVGQRICRMVEDILHENPVRDA